MLNNNKKALVLGAGGFIGSHMVKRLKKEGYWVGYDWNGPAQTGGSDRGGNGAGPGRGSNRGQ